MPPLAMETGTEIFAMQLVPFVEKQVACSGPAKVLVPVPEITSQGELPLIRLGEIEPLSVDVADQGVAIAACDVRGRNRSGRRNRVFNLDAIDIEIRGLI